MHEYAIAEGVLAVVEGHADGRRVEAVDMRIGHLRQVVREALEFSFGIVADGSVAEGAQLRVQDVVPRIRCAACDAETETSDLPLACGACGGLDVAVLAGEELQVEAIEVKMEAM